MTDAQQPGKRSSAMSPEAVQVNSRRWWSKNPMAYDWHNEVAEPPYSSGWFERIDAAFLHGSRLFATDRTPFDRIIPFEQIRGKRVLEIGCGMGLHTEVMARAGADVTAIDLTPTAVEATTRRLQLKNFGARVMEADAEHLPFPDGAFDFVWSWGVIHHSSRTGRLVREIARVLAPSGECRIMVYNRDGMPARIIFLRDFILKAKWRRQTFEETLYQGTDGFSARYYGREQFEDLFRTFFHDVSSVVVGQEADAVPLPRALRRIALRFVSEQYLRDAQSRRGGFIFLTARLLE
jgi:SAM-dependent methyltransferase